MKKRLYISGLLLIMASTILAMEITNKNTDNSEMLSSKVQEFCRLFSVQPEETFGFPSSTSPQKFLNEFNNSINIMTDCSKLRQGIFIAMQILNVAPRKEKEARNELKMLSKTMHKRLALLTGDDEPTIKEYCYNVLDCLSEEEEEKNSNGEKKIRKIFDKYTSIENSIALGTQTKNEIQQNTQQGINIIIGKRLEIKYLKEQLEQAEKDYTDLINQENENLKEIEAIDTASNLLKTEASKQLLKMQKREQELQNQAQEQHALITQLQNEKTQLEGINMADRTDDDTNKLANKQVELSSAHKKLMELKIELSYVAKYLSDAKEQSTIQKTLKGIAWLCNLYSYPPSTQSDKN